MVGIAWRSSDCTDANPASMVSNGTGVCQARPVPAIGVGGGWLCDAAHSSPATTADKSHTGGNPQFTHKLQTRAL